MEYANWRSGQPDNWKDNENCVTMNSGCEYSRTTDVSGSNSPLVPHLLLYSY